MTTSHQDAFVTDLIEGTLALVWDTSRTFSKAVKEVSRTVETTVGPAIHSTVEQGTDTIGRLVTPIAENPAVKYATKIPGMSWLMAALGQVDVDNVLVEVEALKQQHPSESPAELAQRVMTESAWNAAQVGLITNFIPPLAFATAALDAGAVAALQAKMIYRIAAIYGFSPKEPARRGEVLAIWGLSSGGSGVLKSGLNLVELLPGIGAAIGVTADAALLYGVGYLACQFYENKRTVPVYVVREEVPSKIEID
ncbi:EcsC family protein [Pseudanabaena sp. FACHB-2040]|uniref:EcsC family protein n=1 Tax=Pseudanabaena sp. FACHB-2040 TaxID=2692859 RepID=UPI0016828089|nr:EcsC family protein [Pseudanabaena sp. FACHB-2040]MBD0268572.1 EcsC family protein [Cyanobacteria bacterium Co-bin8]MBD2256482.1 EcsC family protein [Pseudanabaena sp. FACHB-2040]